MTYKGHVEKGVIVLDDPVTLKDGTHVTIVPLMDRVEEQPFMALRGTPYYFEDPIAPALPESDWEATR